MLLYVEISIEIGKYQGRSAGKLQMGYGKNQLSGELGGGGKEFPSSLMIYSGILFLLITFAAPQINVVP